MSNRNRPGVVNPHPVAERVNQPDSVGGRVVPSLIGVARNEEELAGTDARLRIGQRKRIGVEGTAIVLHPPSVLQVRPILRIAKAADPANVHPALRRQGRQRLVRIDRFRDIDERDRPDRKRMVHRDRCNEAFRVSRNLPCVNQHRRVFDIVAVDFHRAAPSGRIAQRACTAITPLSTYSQRV